MCDICMHSPCLSGCPNAPDPTPVTHCCSCGEPIIPGDEYGIIDGEAWCEDCLEDLPLCVLILESCRYGSTETNRQLSVSFRRKRPS